MQSVYAFHADPTIQKKCKDLEDNGELPFRSTSSAHQISLISLALNTRIQEKTEFCNYIGTVYEAQHNLPGNHGMNIEELWRTEAHIDATNVPLTFPPDSSMHLLGNGCDPK
jgi:hypothetical protein